MSEHCWHSTGQRHLETDRKGSNRIKCCYCGAEDYVWWEDEETAVYGHGPFFAETRRVWEWPLGSCPKREVKGV